MKEIIDNFSDGSPLYKKYRPVYPNEFFNYLLEFVEKPEVCWDCGTGNGQIAMSISEYFQKVCATDISKSQIANAVKKANVEYRVERAEKSSFKENSFDLIVVAQAAHWFDFDAFTKEVNRVSKNDGVICICGYGLLKISPEIDLLIHHLYQEILGDYWDKERRHVEEKYQSIDFNFRELPARKDLKIRTNWTLEDLKGYLNSWSSVHKFKAQHKGENPSINIEAKLEKLWNESEVKEITFPIFMRIGKIEK